MKGDSIMKLNFRLFLISLLAANQFLLAVMLKSFAWITLTCFILNGIAYVSLLAIKKAPVIEE